LRWTKRGAEGKLRRQAASPIGRRPARPGNEFGGFTNPGEGLEVDDLGADEGIQPETVNCGLLRSTSKGPVSSSWGENGRGRWPALVSNSHLQAGAGRKRTHRREVVDGGNARLKYGAAEAAESEAGGAVDPPQRGRRLPQPAGFFIFFLCIRKAARLISPA